MSDAENNHEDQDVPATPQAEPGSEASKRSRRRVLRAALAAEAGYILSMRAG
jgi:hypothetical protein